MKEDWKYADKDLSKISISSNPNNEPVSIHGSSDRLNCIGIGTDAAVFQSIDQPAYAYKMYADDKVEKIQIERRVYDILGDSPYFSTCYGSKDDYLVLSFEEGITLYDCLLQGIPIPTRLFRMLTMQGHITTKRIKSSRYPFEKCLSTKWESQNHRCFRICTTWK